MGELDWLLDNLVSSVLGVRIAVILSPDGLLLGKSPGVSRGEGDHLAALAASAQSLARRVGGWTGYGDVSQTIIEMDVTGRPGQARRTAHDREPEVPRAGSGL